ncbi:oxidoreductase-like domain-containing protein [Massilia sp. CF038]|uniref:oxidoreductase-like domain-containing protein n=1 Tax=Massilia sp. CF038 TaxID=1881045 RepID=UPI0009102AC3|nr:oxidoreductase-like domain-containing protein [Massilia sp. CF038]SHG52756.1 Oxidoreductase-like protein, N-terminal [Massilia sp. CF038]
MNTKIVDHGALRPTAPTQPTLEDCCRSGCTPCVFDLYEDAMERYRLQLKQWEARRDGKVAAPNT